MSPLRFIEPALPRLLPAPPGGDGWLHEVKFDGWRIQLHKQGRSVQLLSRHGHDITKPFRSIAEAVAGIPARAFIIDGELVAHDAGGLAPCLTTTQ